MTTIYFMRHSKALKYINLNNNDSLQIQNEKWPLTIEGEEIAEEKSKNEELKGFDVVISSNYVRAISTAKYFSNEVYVDESFGERKFGGNSWDEITEDYYQKQFNDHNYKLNDGESLNEVFIREEKEFNRILNEYKDKKILIVGHSTSGAVLLSKWCEINSLSQYMFNGKEIFDGKWNYCETFKLVFDGNEIISIENIKE